MGVKLCRHFDCVIILKLIIFVELGKILGWIDLREGERETETETDRDRERDDDDEEEEDEEENKVQFWRWKYFSSVFQ